MKPFLIFLSALIAAFLLNAFSISEQPDKTRVFDMDAYKKKNIIPCSPDWSMLKDWLEESDIPPMPGSGTHVWKISTSNDSAQFYFNQGINMYYGFHIIESMASFKKATRFDPDCAMLHWSQALAYGPNINDYGYRASPEALAALKKAIEKSSTASAIEQDLIAAMAVRYTADSTDATRESLNKLYTAKMKAVHEKYPGNADAQVLYIDAMMLEHPWDLWYVNGKPKPWTPLIREKLEDVLRKDQYHPGANHYYIHVMEPSPFADKALPSADRLGTITPKLSHMVHMPSHIYLRTGQYAKGSVVNENAVNGYREYQVLFEPVSGNEFLYVMHNLHMQTNHAMLAGRSVYALSSAADTRNSVPGEYLQLEAPLGSYMQYMYSTPVMVNVRFAKWNEMLEMEVPSENYIYASLLHHFGRGMAFANKNKLTEARKELDQLKEKMKDSSLYIPMSPFSPVIEGAKVAMYMLTGTIAMSEKKYDEAIAAYRIADAIEVNMVYTEPRDWMLNPKHYLGHAYLKASRWKDAEKILEADLVNNKENGWALYGLFLALTAQEKRNEAKEVMNRYNKAFAAADISIGSSVY